MAENKYWLCTFEIEYSTNRPSERFNEVFINMGWIKTLLGAIIIINIERGDRFSRIVLINKIEITKEEYQALRSQFDNMEKGFVFPMVHKTNRVS